MPKFTEVEVVWTPDAPTPQNLDEVKSYIDSLEGQEYVVAMTVFATICNYYRGHIEALVNLSNDKGRHLHVVKSTD